MSTPESNTLWPAETSSGRQERIRRVAGWASIGMFFVWIGFTGLAVAWNLDQRSLINRAKDRPFSVTLDEVRDADARVDFLNRSIFVLLFITAAVFITWQYLEYRRVQRANEPTRYDAGWAIGGWFVPFLNWVRPFQVMQDVWKATVGRSRSEALVVAWWASYLLSGVLAIIANGRADSAETLDDVLSTNGIYLARAASLLVASVLALVLVRSVLRSAVGEASTGELPIGELPTGSES